MPASIPRATRHARASSASWSGASAATSGSCCAAMAWPPLTTRSAQELRSSGQQPWLPRKARR
eukprot:119430-Alexandrium_andersonii.AAC.1